MTLSWIGPDTFIDTFWSVELERRERLAGREALIIDITVFIVIVWTVATRVSAAFYTYQEVGTKNQDTCASAALSLSLLY